MLYASQRHFRSHESFHSEQEREATIQRNRALLEGLGIQEAAVALAKDLEPPKKPRTSTGVKKQKRSREDDKVEAPRRQSLRLRKEVVDPNESPSRRKRREVYLELPC